MVNLHVNYPLTQGVPMKLLTKTSGLNHKRKWSLSTGSRTVVYIVKTNDSTLGMKIHNYLVAHPT